MMTRSCRTAEIFRCRILMNEPGMAYLNERIRRQESQGREVFFLVDENTFEFCLPILSHHVSGIDPGHVIRIEPGEENKSVETAARIWERMAELGCSRDSLVINIGGGVITDLGGFVASTFHRGMPFIHVPTTLLGMVDAAIGGKNGVNLGILKNQVGVFQLPEAVIIHPRFLKTLPVEHLASGLAEVAKTALAGDARLWRQVASHPVREILATTPEDPLWTRFVMASAEIKNAIVRNDFRERKHRKALNFGHTIGHALESFYLDAPHPISHGTAVAWGMMAETLISQKGHGLPGAESDFIMNWILDGYGKPELDANSIKAVIDLMHHDKKKSSGRIQFTLLAYPGRPLINRVVDPETVLWALSHLFSKPVS